MGRSNPSTSPDARVVRTRETLRKALLALLEQKPFDQITIREITAAANIGYATFFRHYAEPRALLNDLLADEIKDLLALALPVLRVTDTRAAAMTLCRHVDEHRQLWSGLMTGSSAGTLREEFIRQAKRVPKIKGKTSLWLPTDLRIVFGVAGMFEVLAWWLQQRTQFKVEQVAEILDRLVVAPMMTED